jgi:hypothetical protein
MYSFDKNLSILKSLENFCLVKGIKTFLNQRNEDFMNEHKYYYFKVCNKIVNNIK